MQTFEEAYRELDVCNEGIKPSFEKMWNMAQAAMRFPNPCGQKFADGTPHPMACWKNGVEEYPRTMCTTDARAAGWKPVPHCLICDSEAKHAAETERQFEIADSLIREERKQLRAELTALRAEMKDADDRAEASNESVLDDNELLQLREGLQHIVGDLKHCCGHDMVYAAPIREEIQSLLTPPAASGRCKACSAETVTADESGLCAPCRIVRDGLHAKSEEGQKS